MGATTIKNVRIAGLASAVPPLREVSWEEFGVPAERFTKARSQGRRPTIRAAKWEQCQSDFCTHAAKTLLVRLGWDAAEIDVVVLVTLTPDYPIPATAIILQDRLGIKKTALAFDLPGGEATFFHGLQLVASMLSAGHLKRGLLLCGGVSKVLEDTANIESIDHLCGHNGSVIALEYSVDAAPMTFANGGDGAAHDQFFIPIGGTRRPPEPEMFQNSAGSAEAESAMQFVLKMEAVEAAAVRELPATMRAVLSAAELEPDAVDHTFLQPMSLATDDAVRRACEIPRDRFHSFPKEYGSAGSGSIVLNMLARAASSLSSGERTSLLAGIGAGFAWSSAVLRTDGVVCVEPLEM